MWQILMVGYLVTLVHSKITKHESIFRSEQIIFSSDFNITRILVPADGGRYLMTESSEIPSIFFTVSDPKLEGGSCIYVLEGFAAYEILEGGRDSTADYSVEKTIFFGGNDGLYQYNPDSLSAKKYGLFRDDILQLQKANGTDAIFILNSDYKMYKIEKNGSVKTRIQGILCALQFVLDTSNNIYYVACDDRAIHILKHQGNAASVTVTVMDDFKNINLLRPAFIMEKCIPFFADGTLYILHVNGTTEKKDFYINESPVVFSVDAALYLVAALNGKIYEFNVMEVLLKSMFGISTQWPNDVTRVVMAIIDSVKEKSF